ncbi:MAG: phosphotransferase [Mycobacteriaceae bacterium]|nr:phosphotransferase [Mycobacteriaceae bacterium]
MATDLSAEWLTSVLGAPVSGFSVERIGTGQMSECYHVTLDYGAAEGPASVVLKVAAADPMSRQTGVALGLYEREVRFYTEVAPKLPGPLAPCYHASFDAAAGTFALLLGDAGPADVGDEITGTTPERARLAVTELARLHGPAMGDPALAGAPWLNRESPVSQGLLAPLYAGFIQRYGGRIAPRHKVVCDRLVAGFDAYLAADQGPHGLVHGDYRLDNLLFGRPGAERPLTVVDWQTVTWGPAMTDLAYFLGSALRVEVRRAHADELLSAYHEALGPDAGLTLDQVHDGVRRASFFGVMMAIVSPMLVQRTDRGDEMFMAIIERHCQHVLDSDALALLPESVVAQPLQPAAGDEAAHPPGGEPMWNESWYCDFADPAQGVGGYVRLGLTPNEGVAWFTALLCGPGRPTVAIVDFVAPVPRDPFSLTTERFEFSHRVPVPLQTYRVRLSGRGEAFDDPAGLLRGESGRQIDVGMDLEWTTAGTPYQYRVTTRYEIPCAVSGTVTADGQRIDFDAAPGQRDHSWGIRDWWSMDWVWSALHLDDGAHLHGLDLRLPGTPPIGLGYLQEPQQPLTELQAVTARETFAANGLPLSTTLTLNPGALEVNADIQGHAPLRLVAPDGRVSLFARAWATVGTSDGRRGAGWIEWNRHRAT